MKINKSNSMAINKKKYKSLNNSGLLFYILLLIIPLTQFTVFYIVVNFNSILLAFKEYKYVDGVLTTNWVGWKNFADFIGDISEGSVLSYAIKNSVKLYVVGLFVGTVLSLLFSFYIAKKKFAYSFVRTMLFVPSMLSTMVMALIFLHMSSSVLPYIFGEDPLSTSRVDSQFNAIILFNIWSGFGTGVLLYSNSMSAVSPDIIEAAEIDGANGVKEFFSIVLPSIFPTLSTFLITGVAGLFINQAGLFNFFAQDATPELYTLGYFLFCKVIGSSGMVEYPYASAAGLLLTAIAVPATYLVKFVLETFGPSEDK